MLNIGKLSCSDSGCILPVNTLIKENIFCEFHNIKLKRKSEFHITIFKGKMLRLIKKTCSVKKENELYKFLNDFNFNFSLTDEIYFLKKDYGDHIRYSRIIRVSMSSENEFEKKISKIIGFDYSIFPHITTHSFSNIKEKEDIGIGIQSESDFEKYRCE